MIQDNIKMYWLVRINFKLFWKTHMSLELALQAPQRPELQYLQ